MMRCFGILLGFGAHLVLGVTVWHLFPFLMEGKSATGKTPAAGWWWVDTLLVLQFVVGHSLFLFPPVRDGIERWLVRPLYGCFFTVATCLSLLLLILAWIPSPVVVWQLNGWAATAVRTLYVLSWGALMYSLSLNGYGYQTGWTPFRAWLQGNPPPPRRFEVRGAYRWLRHPVYLCFLAMVWLTPSMTLDRTIFTGVLTVYIFIGSYLKDRRMAYFLGGDYWEYQARVPGYPLIGFGPLGRWSRPEPEPLAAQP